MRQQPKFDAGARGGERRGKPTLLRGSVNELVRERIARRYHRLAWFMTADQVEADQIVNATVDLVMAGLARRELADNADRYFIHALRERFIIGPLSITRPMFGDMRRVRANAPRIDEAVLVLPITERLLYLLHHGRGYSHERIGDLLGMPAFQSEIGCALAMLRIRELLSTDEGAEA